MASEHFDKGHEIRKEVIGEEYVERAFATADDFNRDFQELITEYCWGACWGREGRNRCQRSLKNLCMLAAPNRPHEFKLHFRDALRNGCTLVELRETPVQIAIYCGAPAGVEAFRLAREVLDSEGVEVEAAS